MRDDKLDPGEAATRTLELIEKDRCDCIVGSLSRFGAARRQQRHQARKVLYNSISQSDQITALPDLEPLHLPRGADAAPDRRRGGRYAFGKYGKRVVFLSADYAYGREMVEGFKRRGSAMRGSRSWPS